MNLAIYLGTVPPSLRGRTSTYIDGKPSSPKSAAKETDVNGNLRRARILELVDKHGGVDLDMLERDPALPIVRKAIGYHLGILVAAGELIRVEQHQGVSRCVVWRRPLIVLQKGGEA